MRRSDMLIADGLYEKTIYCLNEILKEHPEDDEFVMLKEVILGAIRRSGINLQFN